MHKIALTSTMAILIAGPALAAVGDTTFTTGQNVADSCVVNVIGVDSGTADTEAYWNPKTYACNPGTYLADGDTWTGDEITNDDGRRQCPVGSYCAGSGSTPFTYSETSDQGIQSCPSGYANSDAGSDAESDCYRDCVVADVAHIKPGGSVTGRYYSNATNECAPANDQQCATGYHYVAGAPNLTTEIGVTQAGTGDTSNDHTGAEAEYSSSSMSNTIIANDPMAFAVDYGNGKKIRGHGRCSTRSVTNPWYNDSNYTFESDHFVENLTDETANTDAWNCYCQLDGYTLDNGSMQSLSAPWVFNDNRAGPCATQCASLCAIRLRDNYSSFPLFRAAVFGSLGSSVASCAANTVSINWKDASGETHELGTCTYDGALTTPATAPTKRGYTFAGWKFIEQ